MTTPRLALLLATVALSFGAGRPLRAQQGAPAQGTEAPQQHQGPPPEAIDACGGKKSGDGCTMTFGNHSITGSCQTMPDDSLACRPDHRPPPPDEGHPTKP
jgi:hypothetical protein